MAKKKSLKQLYREYLTARKNVCSHAPGKARDRALAIMDHKWGTYERARQGDTGCSK